MELLSYLSINKVKVIIVSLWIISFSFLYNDSFWPAYILISIGSSLRLSQEWPLIKHIIKSYFLKIYQILIVYVFSVISVQYINISMGIERDYLNYSPWIMAVFLSITLLFFLLMIISFLFMSLQSAGSIFRMFATESFVSRIKKHPSVRLLDKTWDICFISLPFVILICFYSENILYVSLRLDAYSSTDCSKQRSNNVYIRKNSNECYLFKSRFGVEQPTLIKSTKE
ncbi:hypothetical protein D3C81_1126870 [compost metagenome]